MQEITLDRIGVADVIFDPAKLRWLSSKHIELMDLDALVADVRPCVDASRYRLDDARLRSAVAATRTHLGTFCDINAQLDAFFPDTAPETSGSYGAEGREVVAAAAHILSGLDSWDEESLKDAVQATGRETQQRGRALYEPLRRALTGREHGPPLPAVLFVQGRDAVTRRLRQAGA
jgi:glutamyl/glutaminyl-tRNA synthetase